jgi:hypothetical protein
MTGLIVKEWGNGIAVGVERARIVNGVRMPPEFLILGKGATVDEAKKDMLEDDEALGIGIRHRVPECLQRALERRAGHQIGTVDREVETLETVTFLHGVQKKEMR